MDPALLALVGLGLFALKKRQDQGATTIVTQQQEASRQQDPLRQQQASSGLTLPNADAFGKLVPSDVQDKIGKIAKALGVVAGAAGVGYLAGEAVGALLGGNSKDTSNKLARIGTTASVSIGAAWAGLVALKVIGGSALVGLSISGVGLLVTAAVWVFAVIIEDIGRLNFGQPGALDELKKHYEESRKQFFDTLTQNPEAINAKGELVTLSYKEIVKQSEETAAGYIAEWNRLRYQTWMRQNHGIGVDTKGHATYGRDRGYFVGWTDDKGDLVVDNYEMFGIPWPGRIFSKPFVEEFVHPDDRVTKTGTLRYVLNIPKTEPINLYTLKQRVGNFGAGIGAGAIPPVVTMTQEWHSKVVDYQCDKNLEDFLAAGRMLASVIAYQKFMTEEARGFGQSDLDHARYGVKAGRYDGEIDAAGRLVITMPGGDKRLFDWQEGIS